MYPACQSCTLTHSLTYSPTYSLTHSPITPLHSLTQSITHSLTSSPVHSPTPRQINTLMPRLMLGLARHPCLARGLRAVHYLSTLFGDMLVTLLYDKETDPGPAAGGEE